MASACFNNMLADKLLKYAGDLVGTGGKKPGNINLTSKSTEGAGNKSDTLAGNQNKPSVGSYKPPGSDNKNKLGQQTKPMKFDMKNFTSGPNA